MTGMYVPAECVESKAAKRAKHKFWFAVCSDIFEHEVVGADVKSPKAYDPKRQAWSPIVVWLWLIREAARQDRERIIKGKVIPLRRGQVVVSFRYLASKANWTLKAARGFLERLEALEMVALSRGVIGENEGTARAEAGKKKGTPITVLTICNYDVYQNGPKHKGTARAQQGHSQGHKTIHRDRGDREDISSSINPIGLDEESAVPLQLAPSLIDELRGVVGQKRADELVAEYLASPYAKGARFINRAFKGWLRKGGIQITGHGEAAFKIGDALAMCPTDARGRPNTKLPTVVSNGVDWKAAARRVAG